MYSKYPRNTNIFIINQIYYSFATLLRQRLLTRQLTLHHISIFSLQLPLHLLRAKPKIPQPRCTVLFQLCIAFALILFQTFVVSNDLGDTAVFDLVEKGDCGSGTAGKFDFVGFACSWILLVCQNASLEGVCAGESGETGGEKISIGASDGEERRKVREERAYRAAFRILRRLGLLMIPSCDIGKVR